MGKFYKPIAEKDWQKVLNQPNFHIIEIRINGQLIGLMLAHIIENLTRKPLILDDCIVKKEYRGYGLGQELYKIFIALGKNLGADCVEGATPIENKPTIHIYEKLGFNNRKHNLYRLWLQ